MVFPILGANTESAAYEIDNSLRFNEDDSAYLSKTWGSEGNKRTMTFSFWFKRGDFGDERYNVYAAGADANNRDTIATMDESFDLILQRNDTTYYRLRTNRLFRDPSAWYHMVIAIDTTDGTASNRFKMYVNGVQETSFATSDYPTQNLDLYFNDDIAQYIGRFSTSDINHWDGHMADFYFIDGTQYAASDFGETNNNGVWVPKDAKDDLTFGTNGFYMEFKQTGTSQNSSGIGADTSGNDNHFAVTNLAATDVTTDTPTNNFATMNPVHKSVHGSAALPTFSEGNLKLAMNSDSSTSSTIAPSKGKWYVEYKQSENTADNQGYPIVAISACQGGNGGDVIGFKTPNGTDYRGTLGNTTISNVFLSAREANDIFGFYIDLDNSTLIIHKNGSTYMNTGYTGGLDWSGGLTTNNTQTGVFHFYVQNNSDGTPRFTDEVNFGNPTFSISSSNSDANGYGSFEYSPTLSGTNYYALCTKNLAEFG
jgi:hypothetical protein